MGGTRNLLLLSSLLLLRILRQDLYGRAGDILLVLQLRAEGIGKRFPLRAGLRGFSGDDASGSGHT